LLDQSPLSGFRLFDSPDTEEVRDALVRRYGATRFDACRGNEGFRGIGSLARFKRIDFGYLKFYQSVQFVFPAPGYFRLPVVLSGKGRVAFRNRAFGLGFGTASVVPSDEDAAYHCSPGLSQLIFRVSETGLQKTIAALTGSFPNRKIEFTLTDSAENLEHQRFRRLINFFIEELDRDLPFPNYFTAELEEAIILCFLTANPHNYSDLLQGDIKNTTPQQLSVAEDYIEANWDRPISIDEIAAATGTGIRNLFATFRKARGYTPMQFLRRIRLEHARSNLQHPDPKTSVMAVSLRCGFQNASHFARHYKDMFGELPGTTLAVAKRHL
jgi:AraC-like DNA-binding protein